MKYLLDTHIILWIAENSPKLSAAVKDIILDDSIEKYVSIVSCWEVSIKLNLGKLDLAGGTSEFFRIIRENGFVLLQIAEEHLSILDSLPLRHRDPFDRLLAATAISEKLILLTDDTQLLSYEDDMLQIMS